MKVRGLNHGDDTNGGDEPPGEWLMIAILLDNWNSPVTWPQNGASVFAEVEWLRNEIHPGADLLRHGRAFENDFDSLGRDRPRERYSA